MHFANADDRQRRVDDSEIHDEAERQILQSYFGPDLTVERADHETDINEAVDWVVGRGIGIAARVRDHKYIDSGDYSIRLLADGGYKSEWQKILGGAADMMLYGILSEDKRTIVRWWLLDLCVLRRAYKCQWSGCSSLPNAIHIPEREIHLLLFRFDMIPADRYGRLIIAQSS